MLKIDWNQPLAVTIRKNIVKACADFNMIENGDKIMVAVSGGKDSSLLLALLTEIQRRAELEFTLEAVLLDQKQPGFDPTDFKNYIHSLGVPLTILEKDTYSIVTSKITDGVYCSLCSRFRRAILYDHAHNQGFTKIALGHHRDDLIETLFLNLFYTGHIASMPPKLRSDDKRNLIIRPLCYTPEKDLIELAKIWKIPLIPCNLCGSQDGMKRKRMKQLIQDLEKEIPQIGSSIMTAMSQIQVSQMLDQNLWDFKDL